MEHLRTVGFLVLAALLACWAFPRRGAAVSTFSVQRDSGEEPAEIDFDDIWFYDQDRSKQIPEINLKWIAAAFVAEPEDSDPQSFEGEEDPAWRFSQRANYPCFRRSWIG